MNSKEKMLKAIHRMFRNDPWVQQLFQSAGLGEDDIDRVVSEVYDNLFIDSKTWGLDILERDLGIIPRGTYGERRSVVEARLKTNETLTLETLQNIAASWESGEIDVAFTNGEIIVTFTNSQGIPTALDDFKTAIANAKPAHLAVLYVVRFLTWTEAKSRFTWNTAHALTWDEFKNSAE